MRYFEIINENYAPQKKMTKEVFLKTYGTILENYSNGQVILRGMEFGGPIILGDATNLNRPSSGASNYFNLMTEFLPSWKKYPPRTNSFICTPLDWYASDYAKNDGIYVVIPLENQTISQAPKFDIWELFENTGKILNSKGVFGIERFTIALGLILKCTINTKYSKEYSRTITSERLKKDLITMHKVLRTQHGYEFMQEYLQDITVTPIDAKSTLNLVKYFLKQENIITSLDSIFDPAKQGIKLHSSNKTLNNVGEIWMTGKVLFVHHKLYKTLYQIPPSPEDLENTDIP